MNDEESNLLIEAVSLLVQRQREAETWLAEQFRLTAVSESALDRRMAELEERLGRIQLRLGSLAAEVDPNLAGAGDVARLKQGLASLTNGAAGFPGRPQTLTVLPRPAPGPTVDLPPRPPAEPPRPPGQSARPSGEVSLPPGDVAQPSAPSPRTLPQEPSGGGLHGASPREQANGGVQRGQANGELRRAAESGRSDRAADAARADAARADAARADAARADAARADAARGVTARADAARGDAARGVAARGDATTVDGAEATVTRAGAWDVLGSTPQDRWGLVLMGGGVLALLYLVLRALGFS